MDTYIHTKIINLAAKANKDSLEEAVSNLIAAEKYLCWQASEHSQTSQEKFEYHNYPSGKEVKKATNGNDVIYTNKEGKLTEIRKKSEFKKVHEVIITFRHQKRRQNGQQIRLLAVKIRSDICPVMTTAIAQMSLKKYRAKQSADLPLAMFISTEGTLVYLASVEVTGITRKAVKTKP